MFLRSSNAFAATLRSFTKDASLRKARSTNCVRVFRPMTRHRETSNRSFYRSSAREVVLAPNWKSFRGWRSERLRCFFADPPCRRAPLAHPAESHAHSQFALGCLWTCLGRDFCQRIRHRNVLASLVGRVLFHLKGSVRLASAAFLVHFFVLAIFPDFHSGIWRAV